MAASIKGVTTLVFGVDAVTAVIMQSFDSEANGNVEYVVDEDGDTAGFALYGGDRVEMTGRYVYKGADIVTALFSSITLASAVGSGTIYVYSYGRQATNTGFVTGTFKAVRVTGITT